MAKFRRAKDIPKEEERVPVSARIRKSLKELLEKEAKSSDHSLGYLLETILEDYEKFIRGK